MLDAVRARGKLGVARAFSMIEEAPRGDESAALLDEAWRVGEGHVLGITGPPGVGKSSLIAALVLRLRAQGSTVGIIAVDPSSTISGGALLGDRTRFDLDPEDHGIFVRSMAARDRLGGLAELTAAGTVLMRALFDHVIVETVGVGQSETAIRGIADTVVLAIQPGSGDTLQFMKAGIVEIPDIAVVTKADLGAIAEKALRDLEGSLQLAGAVGGASSTSAAATPVLLASASTGQGIPELLDAIETHRNRSVPSSHKARARETQARHIVRAALEAAFGSEGYRFAQSRILRDGDAAEPFTAIAQASARLLARLGARCTD